MLTAAVAALSATVLGINAQAAFMVSAPTLTEQGDRCGTHQSDGTCAISFSGGSPMAPGGPAEVRATVLSLNGGGIKTVVGLYFQGFASRGPASDRSCSAADPAAKFDLSVSVNGHVLYQGTLADFAATHFSPHSQLPVPGPSGHWAPGQTVQVRMGVKLDQSADNSHVGCVTDTDIVWLAS